MKIAAHAHMNDLRFINLVLVYLEANLVPHQRSSNAMVFIFFIKHTTVITGA